MRTFSTTDRRDEGGWGRAARNASPRPLGARRSFLAARPQPPVVLALWFFVGVLASPTALLACPFCTALKPTLSQRRESAAVVVLGEFVQRSGPRTEFRLHQFLRGESRLEDTKRLRFETKAKFKAGALALLFGEAESDQDGLSWSHTSVNEFSFVYAARAPTLRTKAAQRLRYFAEYLEHADPLIAEDAYMEFGHAPYDVVAEVADVFDQVKVRKWLLDDDLPNTRKGFYGLILGLAQSPEDRRSNEAFLRKLVDEPGEDLRAGFDGILGGYLILSGEKGLAKIERQFLANPKSADGHVRHVVTALRFYYEYGRGIPRARLRAARRHLLARPEFAAQTIVDLARWQDWQPLDRIAGLYGKAKYDTPSTKRAIVGYLLACPEEKAADHLEKLRRIDPKTVAAAEKSLSLFGGQR